MERKSDFEQERQRLTRWAWGVTVGYGVILLVLSAFVVFGEEGVDTFRRMSPNEVGDLLAGVAGPVAFIWLVYGYFLQGIAIKQQSEELIQNTAALRLQEEALRAQTEELRNSVAHQKEIVKLSKDEILLSLSQQEAQEKNQKKHQLPVLIFSPLKSRINANGKFISFTTKIKNAGKEARLLAISSPVSAHVYPSQVTLLAQNQEIDIEFFHPNVDLRSFHGVFITASYADTIGNIYVSNFAVERDAETREFRVFEE